jgi:signal transduction histidine kinase
MPDGSAVDRLREELAAAKAEVRSLTELLKGARQEASTNSEQFHQAHDQFQLTRQAVELANRILLSVNEELRASNAELGRTSLALRLSGELTSAIVETMRSPLLVLTADLRVESANQAFLDSFQVDRQETIGQRIYHLGNGQWDIPELRRLLEHILPNDSAFDDFEVRHDFGRIGARTMLLNARRLEGADQRSGRIVLVIADITDQMRIANELKAVSVEQLRSNAELDQFAAVASHDLQEPLRMVSSFIGLLQLRCGDLFDDRARKYMAHIADGAQRMTGMIGAILTYSQIGQEADDVSAIDSAIPLADAMSNLKVQIEQAHAVILPGALPRVLANRHQLCQLFQNLLANAVKFRSGHRPAIIRVDAVETAHEWIFAVADNGVGMAEDDYGRIFKPFQRANMDRRVEGFGIGLATCKKIVDHHKGRIWVEARIGVGTTFRFSLPK